MLFTIHTIVLIYPTLPWLTYLFLRATADDIA